jgi:hypothetical protein
MTNSQSRCLLAALILTTTSFAAISAETSWTLIGGSAGTARVYVDIGRTKQVGSKTRAWILYDYEEPRRNPNGQLWRSMVLLDELDCAEETSRNLQTYLYESAYANGMPIDANIEAEKIGASSPPDSAGDLVLRAVCTKRPSMRKR